MATDTSFGMVRQFEDFLVTAIGDLPEISQIGVTGAATAVVPGEDGRARLKPAATDDDDKAGVGFNLNYKAGSQPMGMEARVLVSAVTDNRFFVGFGDSLPETDETMFDNPADVLDIGTQSDAFGFFFDQDATTKQIFAVGAKTNAITVNQALDSKYNLTAAVFTTLGCTLSADRKTMVFYVDGKEVYRIDSATTLIAAVALCPCVMAYEQGTSFNMDVDYLYARKGRAST